MARKKKAWLGREFFNTVFINPDIQQGNKGRVPFDQKSWFEFPKFSYVEWNGIFHQAEPILFYSRLSTFPTKNCSRKCCGIVMKWLSKCRIKLLRVEKFKKHSEFNSSLIFMRETYELFSRKSMQTGRTDPQEIPAERPVHSFLGNQILTFLFSIKNRLEPWQIILHPV